MMEDFNAMCADIEAGLNSNLEAVHQAGADQTALAETLWKGLCRSAYIHYCNLAAAEVTPWQIGFFRQVMNGETLPENVTGMLQEDGFCWLSGGTELKGADIFAALSPHVLRFTKDVMSSCITMLAAFTSPGPGWITGVSVNGYYNESTGRAKVHLTFTNVTTGEVLVNTDTTLGLKAGSGGGTYSLGFRARLHTGQKYRLEVQPLEASCTGDFTIERVSASAISGTGAASVLHTFREEETSQGGLVLVRYAACGQTPALSLRWDGQTLQPLRTRAITDSQGRALSETEFCRSTPVPKDSSLQLNLSCPKGGDLALYEWGAVLI